ncbi:MAG: transposase [Methylobacterium sp.]|nr:transposase [Rhodobacter sp.]MCA3657818.1 transposase [Methylobacterium sp.]MCA3663977.1 transposase [Methylobacterium sp.]MCA3666983.1 transposase [Methylobacterium sp.]MCA3669424.1 transposase [Methylobacterium sp.]
MPRFRSAYPPEFRRQMVELVRSGRTPEELAREFEPTVQSIANWVKQADRDSGRRTDGPTSAEREELIAFVARTSVCVRSATFFQRAIIGGCTMPDSAVVLEVYNRHSFGFPLCARSLSLIRVLREHDCATKVRYNAFQACLSLGTIRNRKPSVRPANPASHSC